MGDDRASSGEAAHDAAEIVRLAFSQAERVTKQAEEDRIAAATLRAVAEADATRLRAEIEAERERLLADAKRDRVLAEEVLIRARTEAEHEAEEVLARASQLARREAEILLEGSRMELLRARDEATAIRAAAERDADAIIAAATSRARSTSAELLAATRRRLGEAPPGGFATGDAAVGSLADDRPPPGPPDGPDDDVPAAPAWHERRYRMDWPRIPRPEDVDDLVDRTISRAMARVFAEPPLARRAGAA